VLRTPEDRKRILRGDIETYFRILANEKELMEFLHKTEKQIDFLKNSTGQTIDIENYGAVDGLHIRGYQFCAYRENPLEKTHPIYGEIDPHFAAEYAMKLAELKNVTITSEDINREVEGEIEKLLGE